MSKSDPPRESPAPGDGVDPDDGTADGAPPSDLTAVLIRGAAHDPLSIRRAVEAGGLGEVWLRVQPLPAVELTQLEVWDASGRPCVDAALVASVSAGGRAAFVHVNHGAGQALLHSFEGGRELEGWAGSPGDLDAHLTRAIGRRLASVVAADDGTRVHPLVAASNTVALVRGRALEVPRGLPLAVDSLVFHDRAYAAAGAERLALVGFDAAALERAWSQTPGHELAARLMTLPERALGPLAAERAATVAELAAIGDATPAAHGLRSVRALELLLLSEACFYTGGDAVTWIDERFLPVFSLAATEPPLDDEDEAEQLEERASVLEAMVEVLPYASPEGSLLEQIDDAELRPLAPWARPGEEYVGSIFVLEPARLRGLLGALDQRDLAARVERFYHAWWRAQNDQPAGAKYQAWRRDLDEKGAADVERFLTQWAEWRFVLEAAPANHLSVAVLFYA